MALREFRGVGIEGAAPRGRQRRQHIFLGSLPKHSGAMAKYYLTGFRMF